MHRPTSVPPRTHMTMVLYRRKRSLRPWERRAFHKTVSVILVALLSESQGFSVKPCQKFACTKNEPTTTTRRWATVSPTVVDYQKSFGSTSDAVGLYVHIPYCRRRCRYCDFAIVPIGPSAVTDGNVSQELQEDKATRGFLKMDATYRESILKEIGLIAKNFDKIPLRSVYFGGGTPSLAPIETLDAILSAVKSSPFALESDAEISIEVDPGTFSLSKLQSIKEMGFNRVSLGVQSFDDAILESIGRCHRREDILESIALLQQVYGDEVNYSIDLISGLPGVSLAKWVETLEMATSLSPSHLSIYDLQVEGGTVFGEWYSGQDDANDSPSETRGRIQGSAPVTISPLPSMDECAFCYKYASRYLRAKGYEHYEISSFAKGNDFPSVNRSRHNQIYWEPGSQWFAVGLGATSSVGGKRFTRPRTMIDYIKWVDEEAIAPRPAFLPNDHSAASYIDLDSLTDIVMTRLRTSDGLDLDWIRDHVPDGQDVVAMIMKGASLGLDLGLAEHVRSGSDGSLGSLRLVDPGGFLFSNSIISSIFVEIGSEG